MEKHASEIEKIFPDFAIEETDFATVFLLKIEGNPVGIFIYQEKGDQLHVEVDYLIEKYRDQGIGQQFFDHKINDFKNEGFLEITSVTTNDIHKKYLFELGFTKSEAHNDMFVLSLR
ncbi:GNAT family N-acetyltransferase [Paracrocinitomix mangrovi]|uniref:GNAT family N-acetyltransferase n=1 Tax=Paracrocinitomix mangrovi TaxID=2862509 RepID=UPI001C8D9329|nr:GNAT family N-acetyltransferase [Paracrocinitomix mangrovi]UKN02906.1 GNAT family N-acetyltransferase [Paracrocinitomix mangrovi]